MPALEPEKPLGPETESQECLDTAAQGGAEQIEGL